MKTLYNQMNNAHILYIVFSLSAIAILGILVGIALYGSYKHYTKTKYLAVIIAFIWALISLVGMSKLQSNYTHIQEQYNTRLIAKRNIIKDVDN